MTNNTGPKKGFFHGTCILLKIIKKYIRQFLQVVHGREREAHFRGVADAVLSSFYLNSPLTANADKSFTHERGANAFAVSKEALRKHAANSDSFVCVEFGSDQRARTSKLFCTRQDY